MFSVNLQKAITCKLYNFWLFQRGRLNHQPDILITIYSQLTGWTGPELQVNQDDDYGRGERRKSWEATKEIRRAVLQGIWVISNIHMNKHVVTLRKC